MSANIVYNTTSASCARSTATISDGPGLHSAPSSEIIVFAVIVVVFAIIVVVIAAIVTVVCRLLLTLTTWTSIFLCVPYDVARVLTPDHARYQLRTLRDGLRRRFRGRCNGQGNMVLLLFDTRAPLTSVGPGFPYFGLTVT